MNLNELNLNRFLYKRYDDTNRGVAEQSLSQGSSSSSTTNNTSNQQPATAIAPGTVITSCILRSSDSNDRIEINPDDTFIAYRNGNPIVLISKDGIFYQGILQPVLFCGEVLDTGTFVTAPSNWVVTKSGPGVYDITHFLNISPTKQYITITPRSGHFRGKLNIISLNSFQITWQESDYDISGNYIGEIPVDVRFQFVLHVLD